MDAAQLFDVKARVVFEENKWSGKTVEGINWNVYQGDALEVLRNLPDSSYNFTG